MSKDNETKTESPKGTPDEQLKLLQIEQAQVNLNKAKRQEAQDVLVAAAELRRVTAVAETAELDLAKKKRETARELASAEENLTYTFYDGVTEESVKPCLAELGKWSRRFPGKPITIILNSPGGSVIAGLGLFDYILKLRADGHHVTVVVLGMAASMGGILLQAGDKRVVGKYSQVLIHEVSAGTSGNIQKMDDALSFSKSLWHQLSEILAERSTLTVAQVRQRALRKDWWLTSSEAIELGFADEILSAPAPAKVKKGNGRKAASAKARAKKS
ncbi:MAG: Clp protease ClpP [Cyanobacteria bacterium SZAS TMP-1]|nr:Clp protease ClpP [Cyanobacteria bacterium SZAS TMP-1]